MAFREIGLYSLAVKSIGIIGASLSGATLAALLGKEGINVSLFDSEIFPRNKPCGEGLSSEGIRALQRHHLVSDHVLNNAAPLSGYRIHHKNRFLTVNSRSKGIGVERHILDNAVLEKALSYSTVSAYLGTDLKKTAEKKPINYDYIVYACGSDSALLANIKCIREKPKRFGISSVWEGSFSYPIEKVEIILDQGYEVFLTPLSKSRINATILSNKLKSKIPLNQRTALKILRSALEEIGFRGTPVTKPIGSNSIGNSKRPAFFEDGILLGDACEAFDAVGGMGMTHAILSAEILSKKLISMVADPASQFRYLKEYESERARMARPLRGFTQATCFLLLNDIRPAFKAGRLFEFMGPIFNGAISSNRTKSESGARFILSSIGSFL